MPGQQTPPTEAPTVSLNGPSPTRPPRSSRTRIGLLAGIGALSVVVLALAAILILSGSQSAAKSSAAQTASAVYQQKLTTALAPLLTANQTLSSALQSVDGSQSTLHQAQSAVTQAQAAVATSDGAVAILSAPSNDVTLQQQTQQALTQETGYLQGVSATLADPIGQSSSALRTLATSTQAAFVPIALVAPGAPASISGTDNLLAWVSGANAAAKKATPPQVINNSTTTTVVAPALVSGEGQGVSYCSPGVYVNSDTTCPFAENVFSAYYDQYASNGDTFGDYTVTATSPATGETYTDSCQESADGSQIDCSHGTDLVNLTTAAISAY